jgi:hypothetical protein
LIDEQGVIVDDVAVGVEPILRLIELARKPVEHEPPPEPALALDKKAEMC